MFPKSKGMTIEKLQLELEHRDRLIEQLERQLYASPNERLVDANTELTKLRTKLEHAERLVNEYKEQLHVQSLKTSVNNSKTHHSEIEFEKIRIRLQKRLEELEPLPELLRQAELKNSDLQSRLLDQEKRISEQNNIINELNSKVSLIRKTTSIFSYIHLFIVFFFLQGQRSISRHRSNERKSVLR